MGNLIFFFGGSGGYSDDEVGAISVTGHGELILRTNFSHRVLSLMKQGIHISYVL